MKKLLLLPILLTLALLGCSKESTPNGDNGNGGDNGGDTTKKVYNANNELLGTLSDQTADYIEVLTSKGFYVRYTQATGVPYAKTGENNGGYNQEYYISGGGTGSTVSAIPDPTTTIKKLCIINFRVGSNFVQQCITGTTPNVLVKANTSSYFFYATTDSATGGWISTESKNSITGDDFIFTTNGILNKDYMGLPYTIMSTPADIGLPNGISGALGQSRGNVIQGALTIK